MSNHNPPAFPVAPDGGSRVVYGMSLRDYFAAKALEGMLANPDRVGNSIKFEGWAKQAYHFADAMLTERVANI